MNKYIIHIIIFLFVLNSNAYAYLDPGSGSIILQAILGLIAASIATISFYWSKFKMLIFKLLKKNKKSEKN
tara:strand:- start:4798 stop:5010 length:213 start_codon:yes stop_codon:yes gene_type:complete